MDASIFRTSPSGHLVPTIGGAHAFVPHPLPPALDLAPLIEPIATASELLGELRGLGLQLPDPYLLINPLQRQEAVSSSGIEGTHTTLTELLAFEANVSDEARKVDNHEVYNYIQALHRGIDLLKELPVCTRLIGEMHATLLRGLPLSRRSGGAPGELKREQNWIGGSRDDILRARFVPPPPLEAKAALASLENFINDGERVRVQPLVFLSLVHYQFETIHPFPDGNGRVGRLLIPLLLCSKSILPQPLLYMSPFFEANKDEYIELMFRVSAEGDWNGWISFFLRGVAESCRTTSRKIREILSLQARYRESISRLKASSKMLALLDLMFRRMVVSIPDVATALNITYRAAQQNVEKLVEAGMLVELPRYKNPKLFAAMEVVNIVNH